MIQQSEMSDIMPKFLSSIDCLEDFIESLSINNLKVKKEDIIKGELFKDNTLLNKLSVFERGNLEGFIITCKDVDIIFVSPCYGYMHLWHARNFFGYRVGQNHAWKNDGKTRFYVNILPLGARTRNTIEEYNTFKNYYVCNIVERNEQLNNWLKALYYYS